METDLEAQLFIAEQKIICCKRCRQYTNIILLVISYAIVFSLFIALCIHYYH